MKTEILGVKIDNLTTARALQKVEDFLKDGQQHYIVTPNPEFLVLAQKDEEFRQILNQADLAICDGIGLIFASWFLLQPLKQRIAGTDLMEKVCQRAVSRKWPVFLLGDKEDGLVEETADKLKKKYPGLEIESLNEILGCFEEKITESVSLVDNRPAVLFLALGAPKQEKWIAENLRKIPSVKLAMGVGGAFNFISGQVPRAPKFLRVIGLEWFWRFCCQPWRIKRIFEAVIVFPYLVIRSVFQGQSL